MSSSSAYQLLSLNGKVALVTGGTSGIGEKTAELFAARGASVVIAARRVKHGEVVVKRIEDAGGKAFFVQCDVSIEEDVKNAVSTAVSKYGRLDIAFNNAGVFDVSASSPHTTSNDAFNNLYNTNVRGLHYCMRYEVEQFLKQRKEGGLIDKTNYNGKELINPNNLYLTSHPYSIINNASGAGLTGTEFAYGYSSTKFAVIGLTRNAALNYAKYGIRVNAVCPGFTYSEMSAGLPPEMLVASTPIGRAGQSEEIAEATAFLASTAASFITGASLCVDGGFMA